MLGGAEWILISFILIPIFLLPAIFFLLTLQKTLNAISPENRMMSPSNDVSIKCLADVDSII